MATTLSSLSTAFSDKDLHVPPASASSCLSLTVGPFLSLNAAAIMAVEISTILYSVLLRNVVLAGIIVVVVVLAACSDSFLRILKL